MKKATKKDLKKVADILSRAYSDNPTVDSLFARKPSQAKRNSLFSLLMLEQIALDRVYLTDNDMGVAVFHNAQKAKSAPFISAYIKLTILLGLTGLKNGTATLKRQKKIAGKRLKAPHYYFWMLAVDPENKDMDTVFEMRDYIFELSRKNSISVLAETPFDRTKRIYMRYGFTEYDKIVFRDDYTIYLLEWKNGL